MVSFSAQGIKATAANVANAAYNTGANIVTKISTHSSRVWTSYAVPAGKSAFNWLSTTPAGIATCFTVAGLITLATANKMVPYTAQVRNNEGKKGYVPVDPSYRRFAAYFTTFALLATAVAVAVEGPQATAAYATAKFAAASAVFKGLPVVGTVVSKFL